MKIKKLQKKNRAVFTLYHDSNALTRAFHLKEIEERIQSLEKIIGPTPENASTADMLTSVEYLNRRLELLSDDMKLESLIRRVQTLRKELQAIQSKASQQIEDQITKTKEEKIEKMSEMMQQWDPACLELPTVITKLQNLKPIHEASADIIEKIYSLETQQKLIQQTLENSRQVIDKIADSLTDNRNTMANNVQGFERRILEIQNKMKKFGL